jgi:hypothetical protein
VLKELAYILYHDDVLRERIFADLGVPKPTALFSYKRYITTLQDGVFGVYRVINAYLQRS